MNLRRTLPHSWVRIRDSEHAVSGVDPARCLYCVGLYADQPANEICGVYDPATGILTRSSVAEDVRFRSEALPRTYAAVSFDMLDALTLDELCAAIRKRGTAIFVVVLDFPDSLANGHEFRVWSEGNPGTRDRMVKACEKALDMAKENSKDPDDEEVQP